MLGHILSPCYHLMIYNGPSNKAQEDGSELLCIIIEFTIFVFLSPTTNHSVQDKFITPAERLIISLCNFNREKGPWSNVLLPSCLPPSHPLTAPFPHSCHLSLLCSTIILPLFPSLSLFSSPSP